MPQGGIFLITFEDPIPLIASTFLSHKRCDILPLRLGGVLLLEEDADPGPDSDSTVLVQFMRSAQPLLN